MVVGVAGKYCAGKSTVTELLVQAGYEVIDVDRLGHEALSRRVADIRATFGETYVSPDGSVDRKRLGSLVFSDAAELRRLEAIVHPEMKKMVRERLAGPGAAGSNTGPGPRGTVINAALLFEMGLDELCDTILWVTAPVFTRMWRARRRDGLSATEILKRFWTQRTLRPQPSAPDVDIHTVENHGALDSLRSQLERLSLL